MVKPIEIDTSSIDIPMPGEVSDTPPVESKKEAAPVKKAAAPKEEPKAEAKVDLKGFDDLAEEVTKDVPSEDISPNKEPEPKKKEASSEGSDKEVNFSKMREQLKTKQDEIEAFKAELEEKGALELTAQEYKTQLDELNAKVTEYEGKVEELGQYRDAIDITKNPVYQEKFIKPIQAEEAVILETAKQYGLEGPQLAEALASKNLAEMENKLTEQGVTPTGIMQIVGSLRKINSIRTEEAGFSKDKKSFLAELKKQQEGSEALAIKKITELVEGTSRVSWKSASELYREDAYKGTFPTAQRTQNKNWNDAVDQADTIGQSLFSDTLKDLESNVKGRTITPQLVDKIAKLSFGYGHFVKDQRVYTALATRNRELEEENAMLKGDSPGHGVSSSPSSGKNGKAPTYAKGFDELANEV